MIELTGKRLTTKHLTLHLLEDADRAAIGALVSDPATTRPAGFLPVQRERADAFWRNLTEYRSAVGIYREGACIGYLRVNKYLPDEPEYRALSNVGIGFLLHPDHRRRGYATEAIEALCEHLLARFDCVWADYFIENVASAATLKRCGFSPVCEYEMTFRALGGEHKHLISTCRYRPPRLHGMRLAPAPFSMIERGEKTIELRLYDEKRRRLLPGDCIRFADSSDPARTLTATVRALHRFASFAELYESLPLLECGYTQETLAAASPRDMEKYYSPGEERAWGVVGIELEKPIPERRLL